MTLALPSYTFCVYMVVVLLAVSFAFRVFSCGQISWIQTAKEPSIHRSWRETANGWKFLFHGRSIVEDSAHRVSKSISVLSHTDISQGPNQILRIQMPWNTLHLVSSTAHYNDLNNAHVSELSLHAVAKEVCPD
jgi:hypothetical protein